MTPIQDTATSHTLLVRLKDPNDQEAWNDFVERYAPRIFSWCRQYSLQDSDAADVTQEVLAKLVETMRHFSYDPGQGRFRGWLKTVTANAVRDLARTGKRPGRGSGDSRVQGQLAALQDEAAVSSLASAIEAGYDEELLREAEIRVALRVKPKTWQAYRLAAVDN